MSRRLLELYLSTSLTVAFSRGMRATSAASGILRPPSTLSTSSRSEAWTSGWRDSSYNDQDKVLEIWIDGGTHEVNTICGSNIRIWWRGGAERRLLQCRLRLEAAPWRCCRRSSWAAQSVTGSRWGNGPLPPPPVRLSLLRPSYAGQCGL